MIRIFSLTLFMFTFIIAKSQEIKSDLLIQASEELKELNFEAARDYTENELSINPRNSKAHLLLGKIYIETARLDKMYSEYEFEKAMVFCLGVEQFEKAITFEEDSALIKETNLLIKIYSNYFFSFEILMNNLPKEGSSYKINKWINREAIVKYRHYE